MCKRLVLMISVVLLCSIVWAALADGTCGENLTWELSDSGVLTISGNGDMKDFGNNGAPWRSNLDNIKRVVVEEGVTSIADNAFYWCDNITSVQLPESVTTIGRCCFYCCNKLTSLTLSEGLISIDDFAFCDCASLKEIVIPASVAYISDENPFKGCDQLERIIVSDGNSVYDSDDGVLYNIDRTILYCYPAGKSQTTFLIPDTVISIAKYAFYWNKKITSIIFPDSVTNIDYEAFGGCTKMTSIILNEGLISIENEAFFQCNSLSNIKFPASLTFLGDYPFDSCDKLSSIDVAEGSLTFKSVDGVLFSADMATLIAYPPNKKGASYTVPNGVTTIGDNAFLHNGNLTSVILPNSLVTIGSSAFRGCKKLTGIQFPKSLSTIKKEAFSYCDGLTSIILPVSVSVLEYDAFSSCDNLVSVTVKNPSIKFNKSNIFNNGNKGLVLTGVAGSTTETYANEKGYKFVAMTFEKEAE